MPKLQLKDALFLGFCAVFIVAAKLMFRWHLNISGHSMFFTMFFLILARASVQYRLAASFTGLLAGLVSIMLGMGKGGPLLLLKFLLPALVTDMAFLLTPMIPYSLWMCILTGGLASASKFISTIVVDWAVGMDPDVLINHAILKSAGAVLFGSLGGLLVPPVARKLRAHGIIHDQRTSTR
ncbi:MAG TPA: hypothetical protein VJ934_04660 [Desulfomicrobiaceae bacterium]|nr:hypothetical protein [Desulfomicrobiaceae bacterium]